MKLYIFHEIRWPFGEIGCQISATIMFFIGCSSIYMLVAISIQRYYLIRKPLNIRKIKSRKTFIIITICCALGLAWSVMPLVGWNHYVLEGVHTSFGVEFSFKTLNFLSFNIMLFATVFALPFVLIIVANVQLYKKVKKKL